MLEIPSNKVGVISSKMLGKGSFPPTITIPSLQPLTRNITGSDALQPIIHNPSTMGLTDVNPTGAQNQDQRRQGLLIVVSLGGVEMRLSMMTELESVTTVLPNGMIQAKPTSFETLVELTVTQDKENYSILLRVKSLMV